MKVASGNVLWRQRKRNWCRTPFTFTVYTLTDRELSVKTGILNESFNLIKLFRIVDISVERTFLQRIFGMSTIVLDTRDQSFRQWCGGVEERAERIRGAQGRCRRQWMASRRDERHVGARNSWAVRVGPCLVRDSARVLTGPGFDGGFDGPDMGGYADGR